MNSNYDGHFLGYKKVLSFVGQARRMYPPSLNWRARVVQPQSDPQTFFSNYFGKPPTGHARSSASKQPYTPIIYPKVPPLSSSSNVSAPSKTSTGSKRFYPSYYFKVTLVPPKPKDVPGVATSGLSAHSNKTAELAHALSDEQIMQVKQRVQSKMPEANENMHAAAIAIRLSGRQYSHISVSGGNPLEASDKEVGSTSTIREEDTTQLEGRELKDSAGATFHSSERAKVVYLGLYENILEDLFRSDVFKHEGGLMPFPTVEPLTQKIQDKKHQVTLGKVALFQSKDQSFVIGHLYQDLAKFLFELDVYKKELLQQHEASKPGAKNQASTPASTSQPKDGLEAYILKAIQLFAHQKETHPEQMETLKAIAMETVSSQASLKGAPSSTQRSSSTTTGPGPVRTPSSTSSIPRSVSASYFNLSLPQPAETPSGLNVEGSGLSLVSNGSNTSVASAFSVATPDHPATPLHQSLELLWEVMPSEYFCRIAGKLVMYANFGQTSKLDSVDKAIANFEKGTWVSDGVNFRASIGDAEYDTYFPWQQVAKLYLRTFLVTLDAMNSGIMASADPKKGEKSAHIAQVKETVQAELNIASKRVSSLPTFDDVSYQDFMAGHLGTKDDICGVIDKLAKLLQLLEGDTSSSVPARFREEAKQIFSQNLSESLIARNPSTRKVGFIGTCSSVMVPTNRELTRNRYHMSSTDLKGRGVAGNSGLGADTHPYVPNLRLTHLQENNQSHVLCFRSGFIQPAPAATGFAKRLELQARQHEKAKDMLQTIVATTLISRANEGAPVEAPLAKLDVPVVYIVLGSQDASAHHRNVMENLQTMDAAEKSKLLASFNYETRAEATPLFEKDATLTLDASVLTMPIGQEAPLYTETFDEDTMSKMDQLLQNIREQLADERQRMLGAESTSTGSDSDEPNEFSQNQLRFLIKRQLYTKVHQLMIDKHGDHSDAPLKNDFNLPILVAYLAQLSGNTVGFACENGLDVSGEFDCLLKAFIFNLNQTLRMLPTEIREDEVELLDAIDGCINYFENILLCASKPREALSMEEALFLSNSQETNRQFLFKSQNFQAQIASRGIPGFNLKGTYIDSLNCALFGDINLDTDFRQLAGLLVK